MFTDTHKAEVYLHIGLHKTATTYLQANIFPKISGVTFYNKSFAPGKIYEAKSKILISNEGMSGCPYLIDGVDYFDQFKASINFLIKLFNKPRFIISFREPASFIHSAYKQYLHEGGTLKWDEFISVTGKSKLNPETFFLSKYVKLLGEKVPEDQLFVYEFDSFKNYPEQVVNEMAGFISGKPFSSDTKSSKKSNSAVPLSLEPLLIQCNRAFGNRLNIRIFGKLFSQRTLLQTYIPRLIRFKKKRDLTNLQRYYATDYTETKEIISTLNPNLYKKLSLL